MKSYLSDSAIGDYGCNVVSGIAIDVLKKEKNKPKQFYINASTLWRNFVSCLDGKADSKILLLKNNVRVKSLIDVFVEDTRILLDNLQELVDEIVIYKIDYIEFAKKHKSSFKTIAEFKGVTYYTLYREIMATTALEKAFPSIFKRYRTKITDLKQGFIMTHIGLDLLPFTKSSKVKLIESFTGEIKEKNKWYTKLKNVGKSSLQFIPFSEVTYFIFGDDLFVKPKPLTFRKHLINLSKQAHWLYDLTSNEFINVLRRHDSITANELKRTFKSVIH